MYFGQITEINAGNINKCFINNVAKVNNENIYLGGITGLNKDNGTVALSNKFSDGANLLGIKVIGGLIGCNKTTVRINNDSYDDSAAMAIKRTGDTKAEAIGLFVGENQGNIIIEQNAANTISSVKISGTEYAGIYAGKNIGTIKNANDAIPSEDTVSKLVLTISNATTVGLIAGYNSGNITYICTDSESTINASSACNYAAGLVGVNAGNGNIENCRNYASVCTGTTAAVSYEAGIAGENNSLVKQCINYGTIGSASTVTAAGIVGNNNGTVEECENQGTIGAAGSQNAAGIVGNNNETVTNNGNFGSIGSANTQNASGIACVTSKSMKLCVNHAAINGVNSSGIVTAVNGSDLTIENCQNRGSITGSGCAAGIVAVCPDTLTNVSIEFCRNYGVSSGYGISASGVMRIHNCLEAAGLFEHDSFNPIAPKNTDELIRNFYVYGETTEDALNDGEGRVDVNTLDPIADNSKWPVRFYVKAETDGSFSLYYYRFASYFRTGISGLTKNPVIISSGDLSGVDELDAAFAGIILDSNGESNSENPNHPNYDYYENGNLIHQGFVGN